MRNGPKSIHLGCAHPSDDLGLPNTKLPMPPVSAHESTKATGRDAEMRARAAVKSGPKLCSRKALAPPVPLCFIGLRSAKLEPCWHIDALAPGASSFRSPLPHIGHLGIYFDGALASKICLQALSCSARPIVVLASACE